MFLHLLTAPSWKCLGLCLRLLPEHWSVLESGTGKTRKARVLMPLGATFKQWLTAVDVETPISVTYCCMINHSKTSHWSDLFFLMILWVGCKVPLLVLPGLIHVAAFNRRGRQAERSKLVSHVLQLALAVHSGHWYSFIWLFFFLFQVRPPSLSCGDLCVSRGQRQKLSGTSRPSTISLLPFSLTRVSHKTIPDSRDNGY